MPDGAALNLFGVECRRGVIATCQRAGGPRALGNSNRSVSHFTIGAIGADYRETRHHGWRAQMGNQAQVAEYAGTLARELCALCRSHELNELAHIFEMAEAAKIRVPSRPEKLAVH